MPAKYLTIQDAVRITEKSAQTIRRLVKLQRIKSKRQRTPQGFNYLIDRESLAKYFGVEITDSVSAKESEVEVFSLNVEPDYVRSTRSKSAMKSKAVPVEGDTFDLKMDMSAKNMKSVFETEGITIESVEEAMEEMTQVKSEEDNFPVESGENGAHKKTVAVAPEMEKFTMVLQQMLDMHKEEKERLYALVEQFQRRSLILEERIKRLEAPKKSWWKLW